MVVIYFVIVAILIVWWITTHNSFIQKKNRIKESNSAISVMLKQRSSLIPNIVASISKYVDHESETLYRVTKARGSSMEGDNVTELNIPSIKLLSEQYPNLKADTQFIKLLDSLEEMELQIQASRRSYNAAVVAYNNYVQMFPSSIIAYTNGYKTEELIEITEEEAANVNVKSLFN
ncbi:MAG: LemA family protein [Flavobacteriaceae bacterium]|jgi:LemA protein|nr:LemA family protein [Flavobacteriaceae bacterium]